MLAARVEPKNGPKENKNTGNFKPLVLSEFQAAVDNEQLRGPATVEESVISASNGASPTGRPAPNAAEKLEPVSPDVISDIELLEQLMLAANHNVVPGEAIEDVNPIRVMLQNGIELDDVLYMLRQKVDRRAYPKNTALASWSEHWFVLAVAEAYGGCRATIWMRPARQSG